MESKRILVVEDDVVLREVLTEKLKQKGYEAFSVEDGEVALQEIYKQKPDLILLDILMPRKGGMEVMEELNKDPEMNKIPIIVISNSGQPVEVQRARELGAKEFLIKAVFDPNEVLEKVQKVLKETSTTPVSFEDDENKETENVNILELDDDPKSKTKTGVAGPTQKGGQRKVLVVEDDKFLRELFVRKMFNEGFDVESAIDAEQVFEILANKKPEVILLDLILPGVDGFEILSQIKKDDNLKDIPVMVISNLGQKEDIDKAMALGAVDFLIKANYTLDEIISRVLTVLDK
ncbi:MAG: response regulator [Candidatus Pacebacteria bacterium]|nr:response regulator [Candidatus Paceibacterota bacterium]